MSIKKFDGNYIADENMRSFLMMGQSNMAGRGNIGDVEPINNFRTYMLRNGRFIRMSEPVNPDRAIFEGKTRSGISLAASFADELAKNDKAKVGLIPCADGGTKLCEWMPGAILYDNAVFQAKLAMRTSKIAGILWHQGESDCEFDEDVCTYKERFIEMITELRRELMNPALPVIIGELSENISEPWNLSDRPITLNKIFREIASELEFCALASSEGLILKDDGIHFTAESQRIFGKRYYDAYKSIQIKP